MIFPFYSILLVKIIFFIPNHQLIPCLESASKDQIIFGFKDRQYDGNNV